MKYLYLSLLVLITINVSAQSGKQFLTKNGEITNDLKKANSYFTVVKLNEDSAYLYREYDLRDTILIQGTYKDDQLKTPHGRFLYYYKFNVTPENNYYKPGTDTNNYIKTVGYFLDGQKNGVWTEYAKRGKVSTISTYKNGKLNGAYHEFDFYTGQLKMGGYYVNDMKDGDWCTLDTDTTVIMSAIYKKGKRQTTNYVRRYAIEPYKYLYYLNNRLNDLVAKYKQKTIEVEFIVNDQGQITAPIVKKSISNILDAGIVKVLINGPKYTPASYNGINISQKINMTMYFSEATYKQGEFLMIMQDSPKNE